MSTVDAMIRSGLAQDVIELEELLARATLERNLMFEQWATATDMLRSRDRELESARRRIATLCDELRSLRSGDVDSQAA